MITRLIFASNFLCVDPEAIIKATGRCYYSIQYVTPEWRSFADVWSNGFENIIMSCLDHPETIHYYVLENINMSYLPCYMQPIVDMIIGLRSKFPKTEIEFPENLRILLTPTDEEGLPLALQSIKYFGCLHNEDYTVDVKKENQYSSSVSDKKGYLNVPFLKNLAFTPIIETEYSSYLSKNE